MFEAGSSESTSRVFDRQAPFLEDLYGRAQQLTGQQMTGIGGTARGLSERFLPTLERGVNVLGTLAEGGGAGQQVLAESIGTANPYLDAVIDALGEDIGRGLDRHLGTTVASGAAGVGGAYGGSRHGIAEGMAREEAVRTFGDAASALRLQDYSDRMGRAGALTASQIDAATRLGVTAPAAYNLGFAPEQAVWMPLQQYAQALGRPAVLGESESENFGFSL